MECNCLPKLESTCSCLPIQESSTCGANCSHGNYTSNLIKVLGTAVLLLTVATGYLLIQTHQLNKSLQKLQINDETQSYLAQEGRFPLKSKIYLQQKSSEIYKSIEYRRRKRSSRRRNRIRNELSKINSQIGTLVNTTIPNLEAGIMKKVAHLKMSANMTKNILNEPVNSINGCRNGVTCLRWSAPESIYSTTFDYLTDTAYNNMPVAIKVRSPGVYLVYAQVAFNGPEQGYEPSIGFETVLVHGDIEKTLIKSYITQDNRGRRYDSYGRPSGEYPFDTVNQMGMFKLECDDYILIRPIGAPNFVFRNTEASYFGIVQINPVRGLLHGDYSCNAQE